MDLKYFKYRNEALDRLWNYETQRRIKMKKFLIKLAIYFFDLVTLGIPKIVEKLKDTLEFEELKDKKEK